MEWEGVLCERASEHVLLAGPLEDNTLLTLPRLDSSVMLRKLESFLYPGSETWTLSRTAATSQRLRVRRSTWGLDNL